MINSYKLRNNTDSIMQKSKNVSSCSTNKPKNMITEEDHAITEVDINDEKEDNLKSMEKDKMKQDVYQKKKEMLDKKNRRLRNISFGGDVDHQVIFES